VHWQASYTSPSNTPITYCLYLAEEKLLSKGSNGGLTEFLRRLDEAPYPLHRRFVPQSRPYGGRTETEDAATPLLCTTTTSGGAGGEKEDGRERLEASLENLEPARWYRVDVEASTEESSDKKNLGRYRTLWVQTRRVCG